jgi:hypothetical protein
MQEPRKYVEISYLKRWAVNFLHESSHLRSLLSLENDRLSVEEFLAKMDMWLKIAEIEQYRTIKR